MPALNAHCQHQPTPTAQQEDAAERELLRIAGSFGRDVATAEAFHLDYFAAYPTRTEVLAAWRQHEAAEAKAG